MAKHSKAVAIHSAIHFQLCTTTNPRHAQWESWKGRTPRNRAAVERSGPGRDPIE
jgi:hypothetical protein